MIGLVGGKACAYSRRRHRLWALWFVHTVQFWLPSTAVATHAATHGESPRVLRRLQPLREWSHEQDEQIFPRCPRACGAAGAGVDSPVK